MWEPPLILGGAVEGCNLWGSFVNEDGVGGGGGGHSVAVLGVWGWGSFAPPPPPFILLFSLSGLWVGGGEANFGEFGILGEINKNFTDFHL